MNSDNLKMRILMAYLSSCLLFGISAGSTVMGTVLLTVSFSEYFKIIIICATITVASSLGWLNRFNILLALIEIYRQTVDKEDKSDETP